MTKRIGELRRVFSACAAVGIAAVVSGCTQTTEPIRGGQNVGVTEPSWVTLNKACPASAPATSLPDSLRVAPQPGHVVTTDDEWAAFAREVPGGWGGVWVEEDSAMISLVDPAQREAAIAKLETLGVGEGRFDLRHARVVKGRWDFAQLYDWYNYLTPELRAAGGLTGRDIQEAHNRLEYYAVDLSARDVLQRRLVELDIPCFLVAIGIRPVAQPVTQ